MLMPNLHATERPKSQQAESRVARRCSSLVRSMSTDRIAQLMAVVAMLACSTLAAQQDTSATSGSTGAASSSQSGAEAASSTEALQKATQNPVADLISLPFQNNS